jgi:hypothetical protein
MRLTTTLILGFCLAFTGTLTVKGQINTSNLVNSVTTNATQQTAIDKAIAALGIGVTNFAVEPYATYAPKAPEKFGGGLFVAYNFSQYAGAGIGLDWLGSFSLVSGDVTLKAPFHITSVFPELGTWIPYLENVEITPFVLAGVATPYSGDGKFNGSPVIVSDVGGYLEFGHFLGGRFDTGLAYGKWSGSGPYDVERYHFFAGYSHGF